MNKRSPPALPVWRKVAGEWVCDDPEEMYFYFRTVTGFGFDLVRFDAWLGKLGPGGTRDAMFEARTRAKAAGQIDGMLTHVQFMWTGYDRENRLVPLAEKGALFSSGRPKGAVSDVTRYLRGERRQGETAKTLWERLKALGASARQPIYFDGDEMIYARTSKPITFEAFEKRLIQRKRG